MSFATLSPYLGSIRICLWALLVITTLVSAFYQPVHWDEGWTFCSGRNLSELGHYGCSYNGNLTVSRLTTSWVPVVMAAAGFELFGLNYLAGRVMFVVTTIFLVFAYCRLVRSIFDRESELVCLAIILTLSGYTEANPVFMGATGWGEVPSLLALTIGFLFLLPYKKDDQSQNIVRAGVALLFFLLSSVIKIQNRTFIATALVISGLLLGGSRANRKTGVVFVILGLLTWFLYPWIPSMPLPVLGPLDTTGVWSGKINLSRLVGVVFDPTVRQRVIEFFILNQLPVLVLFGAEVIFWAKKRRTKQLLSQPVRLLVLCFAAIQLAWFALLAIDFPRYCVMGFFVAAGPAAACFVRMMREPNWKRAPGEDLPEHGLTRWQRHIASAFILGMTLNFIGVTRELFLLSDQNYQLVETIEYLNSKTEAEAVIETYDTQLFAFLRRSFVYPPDDYHAEIIEGSERACKPLTYTPGDYLVLGNSSRFWQLGEKRSGPYTQMEKIGIFEIYRRNQDQQ